MPLVQLGLHNFGMNICYANSLLRFLGNLLLPIVVGDLPRRMPDGTPCVAYLLARILMATVAPTLHVTNMVWVALGFPEEAQQDPGELLQSLLSRLSDECNRLSVPIQFPIVQVLYDETGTTLCERCQQTTFTIHTNNTGCVVPIIAIRDRRAITLQEIIDEAATLPDRVTDFECLRCAREDSARRTDARRTMSFNPRSQIQLYALPRVQELPDRSRRRGNWEFVPTDDILAILCHEGQESFQSGHYFTFVRHPNNPAIWRWYNDSSVSDGALPDSALSQVYIVMSNRHVPQNPCVNGSPPQIIDCSI